MSIFVGVMTGTSIDGLDVAAIRLTPTFSVLAAAEYPLPEELKRDIRALARHQHIDWHTFGSVDARLGELIGECVSNFLRDNGIERADVAAIGSHGQTVHHSPDTTPAFTVQIGDASRICQQTGLTVVSDFRSADIAAGGQGAPLVPPFHKLLFGSDVTTAVCNIGGIANLTILPANNAEPITGFDTGPGNTLLDAWCARHTGAAFDADGAWAASGHADPTLLSALLGDPFVQRRPPKSTGVEHYNLNWLDDLLTVQNRTSPEPADVQATLAEFTARSICGALRASAPTCTQLILCGGGRRNQNLTERLIEHSWCDVKSCDDLGVDGDALEAAAFAWLASQTLKNLPGNAPSVTGARKEARLGTVTAPLPQTSDN